MQTILSEEELLFLIRTRYNEYQNGDIELETLLSTIRDFMDCLQKGEIS